MSPVLLCLLGGDQLIQEQCGLSGRMHHRVAVQGIQAGGRPGALVETVRVDSQQVCRDRAVDSLRSVE